MSTVQSAKTGTERRANISTSYVYTAVSGYQYDATTDPKRTSRQCHGLSKGQKNRWLPVSLSIQVLLSFVGLFASLLILLILLQHFSDRQQGFTLVTNNHYVWTLTPTAVFVVIVAFWRLIDFHCKALQPWLGLSKGPATTERTILLDYVSPFQLVTLYLAAAKGHVPVLATVVGFVILKLITVASTGLFSPSIIVMGPLPADMQYGLALFNGTLPPSWNALDDPTPVYTAYAILAKDYKPADGTTENLVYETFEPVDGGRPNTTYAAHVQAFVPKVDCDSLPPSVEISTDGKLVSVLVRNDTGWTCTRVETMIGTGCDPSRVVCPPRVIQTYSEQTTCNYAQRQDLKNVEGFMLGIMDFRYYQSSNQSVTNMTVGDPFDSSTNVSFRTQVPNIKAIFCRLAYSIETVEVRYNSSDLETTTTFASGSERSNLTLTNFPEYYLSNVIWGTISAADRMFGGDAAISGQSPDILLRLMAASIDSDYRLFLDNGDAMLKPAANVLTAIIVQYASRLFQVNISTFQGEQTYTTERLQVQQQPLFFMVGGLAFMLVLTFIVIFTRPVNTTKYNPESPAALARIFSRSRSLQLSLNQMTTCDEDQASEILGRDQYFTRLGTSTEEQIIHCKNSVMRVIKRNGLRTWWRPLTLKRPFMFLTLSSPLFLIALLQVLQHLSDSLDGLSSVQHTSSFTISLNTRFLPALVMLLVSTLFNCFDFNASTLASFGALKSSPSRYELLENQQSAQLPLLALFSAFKYRYWTACLTAIAAIIGSFLSIVVSSLFTIQNFPTSTALILNLDDGWNLSTPGNALGDAGTAPIVSLLKSENLSYTTFTYGELAFPRFTAAESTASSGDYNTTGLLSVMIPALRSELACTDVDPLASNFSTYYDEVEATTWIAIDTRIPLPADCRKGSIYGNESFISVKLPRIALLKDDNRTYFGQFIDLHVGPWQDSRGNDIYEEYLSQPDNPAQCPTIILVYGVVESNDTSQSTLTIQYCYQQVKVVNANVTISMPNLTISSEHPPVPDENTATLVYSTPTNQTGFPWRLQSDIDSGFVLLSNNSNDTRNFIGSSTTSQLNNSGISGYQIGAVSNFFLGVLFGKTSIAIQTLAKNTDPDQVFEHIQSSYRRYMAQVLAANMRIPLASIPGDVQGLDDVLVKNPNQVRGSFQPAVGTPRMVQDRTSKLVLQVMLAVMFVCGFLAWMIGDLYDVVPWNPYTIVGTMVLFADSRMCESMTNLRHKARTDRPSPANFPCTVSGREEDLATEDVVPLARARQNVKPHGTESSATVVDFSSVWTDLMTTDTHEGAYSPLGADGSESPLPTSDAETQPCAPDTLKPWSKSTARFRLGWWKGDVYQGPRLPRLADTAKSKQIPPDESWRYGIDIL